MSDPVVIYDVADVAFADIRSLARKAAQMVLAKQEAGLPADPRHPAFAAEYIAECDRLLSSTQPLLQDALENAGYAAEGQNVDPFQGIVEVMQNADDRHAHEVRVALRSQADTLQMLIVHNGRPVEYPHVLAMMLPFVSTKRDDADQRGRFGIGLKTLRRIATDIQVHGAPYHFGSGEGVSIVELAPEPPIADFYEPDRDTMLILELDDGFDADAFEAWADAWTEEGLVFLGHLRRFRCTSRSGAEILRETHATGWRKAPCDGDRISRLESRTVRAGKRSYTVYRAYLPVPPDQTRFHKRTAANTPISIATCGQLESAGVFVGFRTRITTNLNVLVDAQFDPTSSREGIQDNRWNAWLITGVAEAMAQAAAAAMSHNPRNGWRFVPIAGEGVTSPGWPQAEMAEALAAVRQRVAELAKFGPERNVPMSLLVFEAVQLTGLIGAADLMALVEGFLPVRDEVRDSGGRWRNVLGSVGVSREIVPTDVLASLDHPSFASRAPKWWVEAAARLTLSCPVEAVHGAPLWLRADLSRCASRETAEVQRKIVLQPQLPPFAARRQLFDVLHPAFSSEDGAKATQWLAKHAAYSERVTPRDELLSFAEAHASEPLRLGEEELREIRDLLNTFTGDAAATIGQKVGQAILLEAVEGSAKGQRSWRRPSELYLPKAIDKDHPNWPNAASGLPGIPWVSPRYEDRLRTGLGKQRLSADGLRSRGARNFLLLLGCEVGPRIVAGPEPAVRTGSRQQSMNKTRASSIPVDYLSPDLDSVLKAIGETNRAKKDRRVRATALLRCLSRDWARRLQTYDSVKGIHKTPKKEHERGAHTATWLDRLKTAAWLPVGKDRFRLPAQAALKSQETTAVYRAEDFVAGVSADEVDAGLARALELTASVRVSDLVSMLDDMRDSREAFDAGRVRLAYQHLSRVAPKGWAEAIGDMPVAAFRARFAAKGGLVLVVGSGGAEWRSPAQVRRGRKVLPGPERYVIDDAYRGLWNLLQISETGLADCVDYLKEHAISFGVDEEDGILIQIYRYMSDLLAKSSGQTFAGIRHVPLACTQEWRARRPILLVENAELRRQLAAVRPSWFFWRPPCDTRALGGLIQALSVTRVEPEVRPIPNSRSIEVGEDLAATFAASVDHLSDTLGRANSDIRSALLVPWEQLKKLKLFVYDDLVPVEVSGDAIGPAVRVSLTAHLRRNPLELHCTADALASRDGVGSLIAGLFDPKVEYPFDGEWALAWQAAEKSEAAALRFTTDDAAHSAKIKTTAAALAAKAGGTVKLKSTNEGNGKKTTPPLLRRLKDFQPGISSVTVVEGTEPPPPKRPVRQNLRRRGKASSPNGDVRAPNTDYSNNQLEDFGWDVITHVLEQGTGPLLEDFRRRHHVGADGAFNWDEFVELKATGKSMQTSVAFSASEYARALESGNKYLLALVYQCEKDSPTRVKLIFDPVRRATIRETEAVRLSNLDRAAGIIVELGEDGAIQTVVADPNLIPETDP